jgi:hypothetical protein
LPRLALLRAILDQLDPPEPRPDLLSLKAANAPLSGAGGADEAPSRLRR